MLHFDIISRSCEFAAIIIMCQGPIALRYNTLADSLCDGKGLDFGAHSSVVEQVTHKLKHYQPNLLECNEIRERL